MKRPTAIVVFARAPLAGRVKTRLIPILGEQGALDLHRAMLRHALHIARQAAPDTLILSCTSDIENDELQQLARTVGACLVLQRGADLGARMRHALHHALAGHQVALLIGCDCPSLSCADLNEVRERLSEPSPPARSRAEAMVFIPASDGGYVLVGARELCDRAFEDIPWGTSEVMNLTRQRLREEGIKWFELKEKHDVDRPADLGRLPAGFGFTWPGAPKF